jgi:hypothetical protein
MDELHGVAEENKTKKKRETAKRSRHVATDVGTFCASALACIGAKREEERGQVREMTQQTQYPYSLPPHTQRTHAPTHTRRHAYLQSQAYLSTNLGTYFRFLSYFQGAPSLLFSPVFTLLRGCYQKLGDEKRLGTELLLDVGETVKSALLRHGAHLHHIGRIREAQKTNGRDVLKITVGAYNLHGVAAQGEGDLRTGEPDPNGGDVLQRGAAEFHRVRRNGVWLVKLLRLRDEGGPGLLHEVHHLLRVRRLPGHLHITLGCHTEQHDGAHTAIAFRHRGSLLVCSDEVVQLLLLVQVHRNLLLLHIRTRVVGLLLLRDTSRTIRVRNSKDALRHGHRHLRRLADGLRHREVDLREGENKARHVW